MDQHGNLQLQGTARMALAGPVRAVAPTWFPSPAAEMNNFQLQIPVDHDMSNILGDICTIIAVSLISLISI